MRNHLRLLVQDYGLKLFTLDAAAFPQWHMLLDPANENGRAIQVTDADCALQQRAGASGLIYTSHPEAVKKIAAEINKLPRRVVSGASLEPPPNVRILHIREGEAVTEPGCLPNCSGCRCWDYTSTTAICAQRNTRNDCALIWR